MTFQSLQHTHNETSSNPTASFKLRTIHLSLCVETSQLIERLASSIGSVSSSRYSLSGVIIHRSIATSKLAKLQVELSYLTYIRTRLVR
jgi:hypothetical protein